ncbi:hypothetical protein BSKO_01125 [Bryopsis sp. KO-2023]|nr:hypothetical protein BSKO_01125 [Bryopsis sp. KO-2023]
MRSCRSPCTTSAALGAQRSYLRRAGRTSLNVRAAATTVPSQYKTVTPLGGRMLVKVDSATPTTTGGIMLPAAVSKTPTRGSVISTSGEIVQAGSGVVYSQYAGTNLKFSDQEYILLKEDDVVGTLDSGADIGQLAPLADRLLIEVADADETSAGGVLLTSATSEKPTLGKVVAVGPGQKKEGNVTPVNVTVGSTILYSKYSGTEFESVSSKQYIVIREADVLAELA